MAPEHGHQWTAQQAGTCSALLVPLRPHLLLMSRHGLGPFGMQHCIGKLSLISVAFLCAAAVRHTAAALPRAPHLVLQ